MSRQTSLAFLLGVASTVALLLLLGWIRVESDAPAEDDVALVREVAPPPARRARESLRPASGAARVEAVREESPAPVVDAPEPDPPEAEVPLDRAAVRLAGLRRAREEYLAKPNIITATSFLDAAILAWSERYGEVHSITVDDPGPNMVMTEDRWSLYVGDQYGGNHVIYDRAVFPEAWELRAAELSKDRKPFSLEVGEDLRTRVAERAEWVLKLLAAE